MPNSIVLPLCCRNHVAWIMNSFGSCYSVHLLKAFWVSIEYGYEKSYVSYFPGLWGVHCWKEKLWIKEETQLFRRGYLCLLRSRQGTSKISSRSISEQPGTKSTDLKAFQEDSIWKLSEVECFWVHICLPAEDDDMGSFWGIATFALWIYRIL